MRYVLTIKSENAPGTLYRIAGLLLRKKINIESLHVKEIDRKKHISLFTIEIFLSTHLMAKLIKQIDRVVEVTHAEYRRMQ
ncbi:MAG: ACT domain-containing protein [bacterium]|nr:ACT domain-containing protein [bacterium]